jgi:hypothetical protein
MGHEPCPMFIIAFAAYSLARSDRVELQCAGGWGKVTLHVEEDISSS